MCPRVERIDPSGRLGPARQIGLTVDELLQAAAIFEARKRQRRRQAQLGKAEARLIRVPGDEERIERLAQKARVLTGRDAAVAQHVGVRDE